MSTNHKSPIFKIKEIKPNVKSFKGKKIKFKIGFKKRFKKAKNKETPKNIFQSPSKETLGKYSLAKKRERPAAPV